MNKTPVEIVDARHGKMLTLKTDSVICASIRDTGDYASREKTLLENYIQPNDVIIDVGANIGNHTLFFAELVGESGTVFSFEAQRVLFQLLCGNVVLNNHLNVHCFPNAVGKFTGEVEVPVPDYRKQNNFGGYPLNFDTFKEPGFMVTLDSMNFETVNLIKVDVEGMELDVLQGAVETIQRLKPILYLESNRLEFADDLNRFIASHLEYSIFKHGHNILCLHENTAATSPTTLGLSEIKIR